MPQQEVNPLQLMRVFDLTERNYSMSLVKSRPTTDDVSVQTVPDCKSEACGEGLDERVHVMLHFLEKDIATARKVVQPILKILKPSRSQVMFAILPPNCQYRDEFRHGPCRVSALALSSTDLQDPSVVQEALHHLRKYYGIRANGLEKVEKGPYAYLTYHIDLEAA